MWRLSTSLPYVNVTGPYTGIPRARFSYGFVPTLSDVLKRTPEEFTPMRTTKRVDAEKAHRKIRTSSFQEVFPSHLFSLFLSPLKHAMHERPLNGIIVSAFPKLDPVATGMSLSSTCPLSFLKNTPFVHEKSFTRQGMTAPNCRPSYEYLHLCREVVRAKKSWYFGGMHAGVSAFLEIHVRIIVCRLRVSQQ